MADNIHEGHRQRLKSKFLAGGFEGFDAHNILELLLFYSIPRRDTNEIAHELLNKFGSLDKVFDADFNELINVNGISENSATLIKMIPALLREYSVSMHSSVILFDDADIIGSYFVDKFIGETREVVYLMLLTNSFELINVVKIHEGSINSAQISPRKIIDIIVKNNAASVVLAHNHPHGTPYPSMDDIETTGALMSALEAFDIPLLEHFVIGCNQYYPLIHNTSSLRSNNPGNRAIFRKMKFGKSARLFEDI